MASVTTPVRPSARPTTTSRLPAATQTFGEGRHGLIERPAGHIESAQHSEQPSPNPGPRCPGLKPKAPEKPASGDYGTAEAEQGSGRPSVGVALAGCGYGGNSSGYHDVRTGDENRGASMGDLWRKIACGVDISCCIGASTSVVELPFVTVVRGISGTGLRSAQAPL